MIGGTTASDLATCELKVMKQRSNSNSKPKSNPNPKGKGFLIKGEGEGVWGARWRSSPAGCISALREGLDTAVVVIDGVTFWLTVNENPFEFQLVVDQLHRGETPLISYLDVLENVDPAGVAGLLFEIGR